MKNNRPKAFGMYGLQNSTCIGNMLEAEKQNALHDVTPPKICTICGKGYGLLPGHNRVDHSRCSRIKQKLHSKENKHE